MTVYNLKAQPVTERNILNFFLFITIFMCVFSFSSNGIFNPCGFMDINWYPTPIVLIVTFDPDRLSAIFKNKTKLQLIPDTYVKKFSTKISRFL